MLYHFSEDPTIEWFDPRASKVYPELNPAVWAIDEARSLHYFFPRDCPRIIYWKAETTLDEDKQRFFANTAAEKVIIVENRWLKAIQAVKLYKYTFPDGDFYPFGPANTAGYYISHEAVKPIQVELIEDIMSHILIHPVELRFSPNLYPMREAVISSSLDFSIIRFSNAIDLSL
jgi:hypothetical protein